MPGGPVRVARGAVGVARGAAVGVARLAGVLALRVALGVASLVHPSLGSGLGLAWVSSCWR